MDYKDTRDLGIELYIDPGHGGADPGAAHKIAPDATWEVEPEYADKLVKEAELTEEFALHIAAIAELRGLDHVVGSTEARAVARAPLIREWGKGVKARGNTPLVVSVHFNAALESTACGAEVFVRSGAEGRAHEMASEVLSMMLDQTRLFYPVRRRGVKEGKVAVLSAFPDSSVLIEPAFVTNPFEMGWWACSRRSNIMREVAVGVVNGLAAPWPLKVPRTLPAGAT